jgi:hypothetical protein
MTEKILYCEGNVAGYIENGNKTVLWRCSNSSYGNPTRAEWAENNKDIIVYTDKNRILKICNGNSTLIK